MTRRSFRIFCLATIFFVLPSVVFAQSLRSRLRERLLNNRISAASSSGDIQDALTYQNYTRTYFVHLPPNRTPNTLLPLVIVLHGGGGKAEGAIRMSGMNSKADKEGFIALYPNGTGLLGNRRLTWNTWVCCGYALRNNVDDVGFTNALIQKMKREYPIDPKRIYVTGMSNGGMLTYRLALELSDQIAAVAPVAGAMNDESPNASEPVSIMIFHGMDDKHVLYEGGKPIEAFDKNPGVNKSVEYAVSYWVKKNECNPVPTHEEKGNVIKETYSGGKNGTEVVLYKIYGQGHAWPGGKEGLPYGNVDPPTQEISATDAMWEFFSRHSK